MSCLKAAVLCHDDGLRRPRLYVFFSKLRMVPHVASLLEQHLLIGLCWATLSEMQGIAPKRSTPTTAYFKPSLRTGLIYIRFWRKRPTSLIFLIYIYAFYGCFYVRGFLRFVLGVEVYETYLRVLMLLAAESEPLCEGAESSLCLWSKFMKDWSFCENGVTLL